MIEFIYIKEVAKELDCKDYRTIKRWCKKNGVGILSDTGSSKKYVLKAEFEAVKMKQAVKYIKEKYGADKLPDAFHSFFNFFNENNNTGNAIKYKPQGEHEIKFLSDLQSF